LAAEAIEERRVVQNWAEFVADNRDRHLVVGSTTSVMRWREKGIRRLVHALQPSGRFAFKRDLDDRNARYLVLVAFEHEGDAQALANAVGAEPVVIDHAGFASQHGFALDGVAKKVRATLKRLGATRRLLPH
jgi:hypothetical protein